jgi:hypothetical protein
MHQPVETCWVPSASELADFAFEQPVQNHWALAASVPVDLAREHAEQRKGLAEGG